MNKEKMKAAVMVGINKIIIDELPIPEPKPGEVLIRVKSVGICGSDVHFFTHGRIGPHVATPPFILGHEASGEVHSAGKGVEGLNPGDRVTMKPGVPCKVCDACRTGRYNLCPSIRFWSAPPVQGVLSEYVTHDAHFCYKIPDHVSFDVAALAEPMSVGVYAAQRAVASPGKTAAILGAGPIGQLTLQSCFAFGMNRVIITDVEKTRLDIAMKSGAKAVVDAGRENTYEAVMAYTKNEGVDIVYETAGMIQTIKDSVRVAKRGGTVVQVGNPPEVEVPFPLLELLEKEVLLLGSFRYVNCFPKVVDILSSGRVEFNHLISHRFPPEEANEAFTLASKRKQDCMKIMINF